MKPSHTILLGVLAASSRALGSGLDGDERAQVEAAHEWATSLLCPTAAVRLTARQRCGLEQIAAAGALRDRDPHVSQRTLKALAMHGLVAAHLRTVRPGTGVLEWIVTDAGRAFLSRAEASG